MTCRVLVDLNVVLDVLLDRAPHAEPAAALWAALDLGWADFEDADTAPAGAAATCHVIATRDADGFRRAALLAMAPIEALAAVHPAVGG